MSREGGDAGRGKREAARGAQLFKSTHGYARRGLRLDGHCRFPLPASRFPRPYGVTNLLEHLSVCLAGGFGDVKAVVCAFDPVHLPIGRHTLQYFLHQARRAEWVACAVEADHGDLDRGQMRVTQLIRFPRRMQRIRQQQQSIALESVRSEHRRCSAAHGPAPDDELACFQLLTRASDDRRQTILESRHWIGTSGFLFLVQEVEPDDAESPGAQRVRGLKYSAIVHVAASAVGKDEYYALLRPARRGLEYR